MRRVDMRRWTALASVLAFAVCLAAPVAAAGNEDDLTVIKRAVRGGHASAPEKGLKWFKVLITDGASSDVVKVNLPIFAIGPREHGPKDRHPRGEKGEAKARNLKKLGPLILLEILGDDAKIKIWLE
jgi:hypothetical protein